MKINFSKVDKLQAKLKKLRPLTPSEINRLREEFVIENTYNSNAIEGNSLTLRETALVLDGVTIGEKPLKDHLEAIGHKEAFGLVFELAKKNVSLGESIVKQIHTLVMMNDRSVAGVYRSLPVRITGAVHTPPQPYLVSKQMEELVINYESLKKEKHIIESIAEFHLRFEGIHPFLDGNGRTGRLIINLELIRAGLLPINIKYSDQRKYYDCFDDYYGNKQTTDTLTKLILDYEIEELERYISIIEEKEKLN
ncbi:MAG: Fic family protein [Firmicutes bacterium]|nr:Fic family protein [Bacillota bacterium]